MNGLVRKIKTRDAEKLLGFFVELVEKDPERVERPEDVRQITVEEEVRWIESKIEAERNKKIFVLCCEVDGTIVAEGEVERCSRWIEQHDAEIRFGVLPGHEELAARMVRELMEEAKKEGIENLFYFHLATQKRGITIIESLGFSRMGVFENYYKRGSGYIDRIYFTKRL